jgi:hypothetical protein
MADMMTRRGLLQRVLAVAPVALGGSLAFAQAKIPMVVYKDPGCGCCEKWVAHMTASGFTATVHDTPDMTPIRARYKVTSALAGCHTAIVGNYVVEGHVPASDVKALLAKKPAGILGLTVPGMPASAPGMDTTPFRPYTVLTFDAKGATTVFAQHNKA